MSESFLMLPFQSFQSSIIDFAPVTDSDQFKQIKFVYDIITTLVQTIGESKEPQSRHEIAALSENFNSNNTIVAGGSIRDVCLGKPIKDIDIYTTVTMLQSFPVVIQEGLDLLFAPREDNEPPRQAVETVAVALNSICDGYGLSSDDLQITMLNVGEEDYIDLGEMHYPITQLIKFEVKTAEFTKEVDFITVSKTDDPRDYVKREFGANISKIWYDREKLTFTSEFIVDVDHKLITCDIDMTNRNASFVIGHYLNKVSSYFPDHKVVLTNQTISTTSYSLNLNEE